jgi:hypothetical protein
LLRTKRFGWGLSFRFFSKEKIVRPKKSTTKVSFLAATSTPTTTPS